MSDTSALDLTYQELVDLTPGIFTGQPEIEELVTTIAEREDLQRTGPVHLLLATHHNARGEIDAAEDRIWSAVRCDPEMMSKLVPAENPNFGLALGDSFERIDIPHCPVCGGGDRQSIYAALVVSHPLYHPGLCPVIHWVQCQDCRHVYAREQNPARVFAEGPERTSPHMFVVDKERYSVDFASVQHLVADKPGRHALELGPGAGTRLAALCDLGFVARGVELRPKVVEHCRALGLDVVQEDFYAHRAPAGGYDLVVLGDVIEHLPDLERTVKKCRELLANDGRLWISTPLFDTFVLAQLRRKGMDPYFGQVEHVHYFTRRSLVELVARHGFGLGQQRLGKFYLGAMEFTFDRQ